jgi:hypothetical protein
MEKSRTFSFFCLRTVPLLLSFLMIATTPIISLWWIKRLGDYLLAILRSGHHCCLGPLSSREARADHISFPRNTAIRNKLAISIIMVVMVEELIGNQTNARLQDEAHNNIIKPTNRTPRRTDGSISSSPISVVPDHHDGGPIVVEPMALTPQSEPRRPTSYNDSWLCPASAKSLRTINPIRAIVDPIAKNIQTGTERGDGKDPISLAVSTVLLG